MRCRAIVVSVGLCLCLSGCRLAVDVAENACFETRLLALDVKAKVYYPVLARSAWEEYRGHHPDECASKDFACGFKRGYADYLERGGDGSSRLVPPVRYWQIRNDTPEGRAATAQWQAGFRAGAEAARASGLRQMIVVPVADPAPSGPPPGPPAGEPDLGSSPPPAPTPSAPELPRPQMLPDYPPGEDEKRAVPPPPPTPPAPAHEAPPSEVRKSKEQTNDVSPRTLSPSRPSATVQGKVRPKPVQPPRTAKPHPAEDAEAGSDLPRVVASRPPEPPPAELPRVVTGDGKRPQAEDFAVDWSRVPRNADMLAQVGILLLQGGNAERGVRWLQLALEVDPDHAASHRALTEYYQQRGDYFRAAEHRVKAAKAAEAAGANKARR